MATTEQVDWLWLSEAAEVASVDRATLHRAAVRGEVVFAVVGTRRPRRVFRADDVLIWAEQRREAA